MQDQQQTKTPDRVWLSYVECANYTGYDRVTLWRAVQRGDLRQGGIKGAPRFHVNDVEAFMRRKGCDRD
jgi:hypothetical protein